MNLLLLHSNMPWLEATLRERFSRKWKFARYSACFNLELNSSKDANDDYEAIRWFIRGCMQYIISGTSKTKTLYEKKPYVVLSVCVGERQ